MLVSMNVAPSKIYDYNIRTSVSNRRKLARAQRLSSSIDSTIGEEILYRSPTVAEDQSLGRLM